MDSDTPTKPLVETDSTASIPASQKLGLSKLVYALGTSARDAGAAFAVTTAIVTGIILAGKQRFKAINIIAELPKTIETAITNKLAGTVYGSKFSEFGSAVAVAAGVATVVSYIFHMPGLLNGHKKVAQAEAKFGTVIAQNVQLAQVNKELSKNGQLLAEDNARLTEALAKINTERPSMAERIKNADIATSLAAR